MELIIGLIISIIIIAFLVIISTKISSDRKSTKTQKKDIDYSKRLSPHPSDTPLGNAEPSSYIQTIQKKLDTLSKIPKSSPCEKGKYLFFDTETTGLPRLRNAPPEDFSNWPYIIEIAWLLIDQDGLQVSGGHYIVKQNVSIPKEATSVHHITTADMLLKGVSPQEVYSEFIEAVEATEYIIAHNLDFDMPIIECELLRNGFNKILFSKKQYCTMKGGKDFCTVYDRAGRIKNPKLSELFGKLYFDNPYLTFEGTHNALADTNMLHRCFIKMKELNPGILETKECISIESMIQIKQEHETETVECECNIPMISNNDLFQYFGDNCFENTQVLVTGVAKEDKEECWEMITDLNGKVVKSVTKNLAVVVLGPIPGWKKIEDIKLKIQSGDKIIGITDIQLRLLHIKLN